MVPRPKLPSVGGLACLRFANTLEGERSLAPHEHVPDFAALVAWARHARIHTPEECAELERDARREPEEAQRVHRRALKLREALYRIVSGAIRGRAAQVGDLALFNQELARALSRARIEPAREGFAWSWSHDEGSLERILWPILRSAADLLASPELERVRECPGDNCDDLFLDTTKNGRRRWCKMQVCGNRAKAKRFRKRARSARHA